MSTTGFDDGAQYVTLGIGEEVFAVNVTAVREVLDVRPFTRVPNMPAFMRGMIDVRGKGVPVIDMRAKFGLPRAGEDEHTRIVVLEVGLDGRHLIIGALCDRVYEVTELSADGIEPPPEVGVRWRSEFISGIGRRRDNFVIVLDLDRLFASEDLALADAA